MCLCLTEVNTLEGITPSFYDPVPGLQWTRSYAKRPGEEEKTRRSGRKKTREHIQCLPLKDLERVVRGNLRSSLLLGSQRNNAVQLASTAEAKCTVGSAETVVSK